MGLRLPIIQLHWFTRACLAYACTQLLIACTAAQRPVADPTSAWIAAGEERLHTFSSDAELTAFLVPAQGPEHPLADTFTSWDEPADTPHPPHGGDHRRVSTSLDATTCNPTRSLVQVHGAHWVILHNGRLSTIAREAPSRTTAEVEVFASADRGHRCDELLIAGDSAVVLSARAQERALELGVFHVDALGGLHHDRTLWLRSSSDYVSRLVGQRLTLYFQASGLSGAEVTYPAWRAEASGPWNRLVDARSVYGGPEKSEKSAVFHTVATCDLARTPLHCDAQAVLAAVAPAPYISRDAVYFWSDLDAADTDSRLLYRMPLTGAAPGAMRMHGRPVDASAFDERDGLLQVLVGLRGSGAGTTLGLARVPLSAFGLSVPSLRSSAYLALPSPGHMDGLCSRFVGEWLLLADRSERRLYVVHPKSAQPVRTLSLDHAAERIDALGTGALISGRADTGVALSTLDLERAVIVDRELLRDDPARGERHVLGMFYQPTEHSSGLLALPIYGEADWVDGRPAPESAQLIVFRQHALRLEPLGALTARASDPVDCADACDDWYDNTSARPLILQTRVIALVGSELIEGELKANAVTELHRLNMAKR